jgi:hypothetical protein
VARLAVNDCWAYQWVNSEPSLVGRIDVGSASTHHPKVIDADVPDTDIVRHDYNKVGPALAEG